VTSARAGQIVFLLWGLALIAVGCWHDCAVAGRPRVGFAVPSCCGSQSRYYWDNRAKDCVALPPMGGMNCGCVCEGECARLFWSLDECRDEYGHCR
jgi:hypothetical protein